VYAQRFNNRHERTGHLFGARFASWVIDTGIPAQDDRLRPEQSGPGRPRPSCGRVSLVGRKCPFRTRVRKVQYRPEWLPPTSSSSTAPASTT
jgi:hypothetical protein